MIINRIIQRLLTFALLMCAPAAFAMDIPSLEGMKQELINAKASVQTAVDQIRANHGKLKNEMMQQLATALDNINNQESQLQASIGAVNGLPGIAFDLALIQDLKPTLNSMVTGPLATIKGSLTQLNNNISAVSITMDPAQDPQKFYAQANEAINYFSAAIKNLDQLIEALKEA